MLHHLQTIYSNLIVIRDNSKRSDLPYFSLLKDNTLLIITLKQEIYNKTYHTIHNTLKILINTCNLQSSLIIETTIELVY